jgi:hypothetical protein
MAPRSFFGKPLLAGVYEGCPTRVPIARESAAFVLLKGHPD